jgi:hypothetical protein
MWRNYYCNKHCNWTHTICVWLFFVLYIFACKIYLFFYNRGLTLYLCTWICGGYNKWMNEWITLPPSLNTCSWQCLITLTMMQLYPYHSCAPVTENAPYFSFPRKWKFVYDFLVITQCCLVTEHQCYRGTRCVPFKGKPQLEAISSTETQVFAYQTNERNEEEQNKNSQCSLNQISAAVNFKGLTFWTPVLFSLVGRYKH